jgi:hypothetical protein
LALLPHLPPGTATEIVALLEALHYGPGGQLAQAAAPAIDAPVPATPRIQVGPGAAAAVLLGVVAVTDHVLSVSAQTIANRLVRHATMISTVLADDPIKQQKQTIAIVFTSSGTFIVAGGAATRLTPGQVDLARSSNFGTVIDAEAVSSFDFHAEIQVLDATINMGDKPLALGSSRPFCDICADAIENDYGDGVLLGPGGEEQGAIWPDHW